MRAETGPTLRYAGPPAAILCRLDSLDDRQIRLWGIPICGIIIPHLTGLFGSVQPPGFLYWLGTAYFIFISFAVWHGNRRLHFTLRRHFDRFRKPAARILILFLANVLYTSPVTVLLCLGWYAVAGIPADWNVILLTTLVIVATVVFIMAVYETVFLIMERASDVVEFERLSRARMQAELDRVKSQVDPHFLFNSLNALAYLIEYEPRQAKQFNEGLAAVYRYILMNRERDLVPLSEEAAFLRQYRLLLQRRFPNAFFLDWSIPTHELDSYLVPPTSLQVLLENAVKHNEFDEASPLHVSFGLQDGAITARNRMNGRPDHPDVSTGTGLANLNERYRLITGRGITVKEADGVFEVALPLIPAVVANKRVAHGRPVYS